MRLLAIALLITIAGCATPPMQSYRVEPFELICGSQAEITAAYHALGGKEKLVDGFQLGRVIGVAWSVNADKNGEPKPKLEALGHEVWHLIKGAWHK